MDKVRNKLKQWREEKKLPKMIFIFLFLLLIIVVIVGVCVHYNAHNRLERQLALGDQYLEDMDYERAIAAYEEALRIDDKCIAAYVGIAEAYTQLGDLDMAIEYLEFGAEKTGSEELLAMLEEIRILKAEKVEEGQEKTERQPEENVSEETETTEEELPEEPEEEEQPEQPQTRPVQQEQARTPKSPEAEEAAAEPIVEAVPEPTPVPQPQPEPTPVPQPQPEPTPVPEPEPEPEPELPPRGTNIRPITVHEYFVSYGSDIQGSTYGEIAIPGAIIKAELCDKYDESIAPVVLGDVSGDSLSISVDGDSDYQYIRITYELPEGYYFVDSYNSSENVTLYKYDEMVDMYSGMIVDNYYRDYGTWSSWDDLHNYSEDKIIVTHPETDGKLQTQPGSYTIKVGDVIDIRTIISVAFVSPDGSTRDISLEPLLYVYVDTLSSDSFFEHVDGSEYRAVKEGQTYVYASYQGRSTRMPLTIEAN